MDVEIDKSHLLALAGDDNEAVLMILEEFYENSVVIITELKQNSDAENIELSRQLLHQLKGSSGMFGMSTLHDLCKKLEVSTELLEAQLSSLRIQLEKSCQLARAVLLG
ncbi:Hpt domain-containing protein [Rubritalea spongiae]|uniref:Hpt domain-containing protein n=1 Tax=Rubritalea spongiae TaxID=430797 RepID=A0ABW5E169_9BACT